MSMRIGILVAPIFAFLCALSWLTFFPYAASAAGTSSPSATARANGDRSHSDLGALSFEGRSRLAYAEVNGISFLSLAVLLHTDRIREFDVWVAGRGARVRFSENAVGYKELVVPTEFVRELASSPLVSSLSIDVPDESYTYHAFWFSDSDDIREEVSSHAVSRQQQNLRLPLREEGEGPLEIGSSILRDIHGEEFASEHEGFDGRGVVVAHVEALPDFLAPELQFARSPQGQLTPKFLDVVSAPYFAASESQNSDELINDREWFLLSDEGLSPESIWDSQNCSTEVDPDKLYTELVLSNEAREGRFFESTYSAVLSIFDASYPEAVRYSGADRSEIRIRVQWSVTENTARFDLDDDCEFSDENPVPLYTDSQQFGFLGIDNPDTRARETIGFALLKQGEYLGINFGLSSHATSVAGAVAGSAFRSGRVEGVAPGAQLIAFSPGERVTSFARTYIEAFADDRVDLVLVESLYPVAGNHIERDGNSTLGVLLQRLVEFYRKPVVVTAGNGTGFEKTLDLGSGQDVLTVGAALSRSSALRDYQVDLQVDAILGNVGSGGPGANGEIKPDILAPATPIVPDLGFIDTSTPRSVGRHELPFGYRIGGGTSIATPVVAGAIARLLGAANLMDIVVDAEQINFAMRFGAQSIENAALYQQGHGLINLDNSWAILRQLSTQAAGPDLSYRIFDRASPVSRQLPSGAGIVHIGSVDEATSPEWSIEFYFRSPAAGEHLYDITIDAANSSISLSQSAFTVRPGQYSTIDVSLDGLTSGAHGAIISVVYTGTGQEVLRIPVTWVIPQSVEAGASSAVAFDLAWHGRENLFFQIPDHTSVLNFRVRSNADQELIVKFTPPSQRYIGDYVPVASLTNSSASFFQPEAGIWQVSLNHRSEAVQANSLTDSTGDSPNVEGNVFVNLMTSDMELIDRSEGRTRVVARTVGLPQTSRIIGEIGNTVTLELPDRISNYIAREFEVMPGASRLLIDSSTMQYHDNLELRLFDCTRDICHPSRDLMHNSQSAMIVDFPRAGLWKIHIASRTNLGSVLGGALSYVVTHPDIGRIITAPFLSAPFVGESLQAVEAWLSIDQIGQLNGDLSCLFTHEDPTLIQSFPPSWVDEGRTFFGVLRLTDRVRVPLGYLLGRLDAEAGLCATN